MCDHPTGGAINGAWVCATCFEKLHDRPSKIVWRYPPGTTYIRDADGPRAYKQRQEVDLAQVAEVAGVTFPDFVDMMARRLVARGGFNMADARDYAIDCLRSLGEPFGSADMAWDQGGAWDIVDEDMTYWDCDSAASN